MGEWKGKRHFDAKIRVRISSEARAISRRDCEIARSSLYKYSHSSRCSVIGGRRRRNPKEAEPVVFREVKNNETEHNNNINTTQQL